MYNGYFSHFCKVSKIHFLRKILECTLRWGQTLRHLAPEGCYLVRSERLPPRHTRNDLCWCSNGLLKHKEKIKGELLRGWRITVQILQPEQGWGGLRTSSRLKTRKGEKHEQEALPVLSSFFHSFSKTGQWSLPRRLGHALPWVSDSFHARFPVSVTSVA